MHLMYRDEISSALSRARRLMASSVFIKSAGRQWAELLAARDVGY